MSIRNLARAFRRWRDDNTPLVLATVISTQGSTYSKAGAQMLIAPGGNFEGLLSGGCLEGDLIEHAHGVISQGQPGIVRYDMRDREEDELWGLGLGCDGAISILLQEVSPRNAYQPFDAIAERIESRLSGVYGIVTESSDEQIQPGAAVIADAEQAAIFGLGERAAQSLLNECRHRLNDAPAGIGSHATAGGSIEVLYAQIPVPPRLLLLGAGPDAVPVVEVADRLGWRVTVADHRPGYVASFANSPVEEALQVDPASLTDVVDPGEFDGAVIMSHHLQSDRDYLCSLAHSPVPYIGLLGPRARRERLLNDVGDLAAKVAPRLYGPAGLDIGAASPEGIALAIVAEMHAALRGRAGSHLSWRVPQP